MDILSLNWLVQDVNILVIGYEDVYLVYCWYYCFFCYYYYFCGYVYYDGCGIECFSFYVNYILQLLL